MTMTKRKATDIASSGRSTKRNNNKRSEKTPGSNVSTRRETDTSSKESASFGDASSRGGPISTQSNPQDRNEENGRVSATSKRSSASSVTTRRQAAKVRDQERSSEKPLDPNNPDDNGDSGGCGGGGGEGGDYAAMIGPPSFPHLNLFSNREFLGMLSLCLEPSELYVCQRVCPLWRDQFSNLFLIRNCLEKRVAETCPSIPSAIRQRREMVLAIRALTEAYDSDDQVARILSQLQKLRNFSVTEELLEATGILEPVKTLTRHMFPAIKKLASKILSEWAGIVQQQTAAGVPKVLQRFARIRSDLSFAELARTRMGALMGRPTSMLLHAFDKLNVKREPGYVSNLDSRAQRERMACFSLGRFAFIASSGSARQHMGNIYTSKHMNYLRSAERPHVMDEDFFTRLTAPVPFTSVVASEEMVVGISETEDETRIYAFECADNDRVMFDLPPGLVLWRVLVSRKTILLVVGSGVGQRSLQHWTYDENNNNNFLTPLNLSFNPKTTIILNDQPLLEIDTRSEYQPLFDLITIDEGVSPNWKATIQQRRYTLDGIKLNGDVNIPIPELAGTHFTFSIDHMWHFTPLVKKILIPVLPDADEVPDSLAGGIDLSYYHTLELTYESATAKLSYRLLPYIDLNFLRLAYLGDDIWYCQKVPKPSLTPAPPKEEGDIFVMEILGAPRATVETRESEIVDILSESLKSRGVARSDLKRQMSAFKGPGILLADPTTGMVVKMNDDIVLSIFSFWSTPRFAGDNSNDEKSYSFHARRAAQDRARQRLQAAQRLQNAPG